MPPTELNKTIQDNEFLYRGIISIWLKEGSLSSAAFKDSRGASVDRDGNRNEFDIIETFKQKPAKQGFVCLATINVRDTRNCGAHPWPDPVTENPYHAIISRAPFERRGISSGVAKRLRDQVYEMVHL